MKSQRIIGDRIIGYRCHFLPHYALRKRAIETIARESILGGYTQVIRLRSGFDSLAIRLYQEFSQMRYIGIDHPSTQYIKKKSLASMEKNNNLHFLSINFATQKLEDQLLSLNQLRPEENTLFIAEGPFMYLDDEHIRNIFQFVWKNFPNKVRFVFTFMELDHKGRIGFHNSHPLVNLGLLLKGESFTWGVYRPEIEQFLQHLGFYPKEFISHEISE